MLHETEQDKLLGRNTDEYRKEEIFNKPMRKIKKALKERKDELNYTYVDLSNKVNRIYGSPKLYDSQIGLLLREEKTEAMKIDNIIKMADALNLDIKIVPKK